MEEKDDVMSRNQAGKFKLSGSEEKIKEALFFLDQAGVKLASSGIEVLKRVSDPITFAANLVQIARQGKRVTVIGSNGDVITPFLKEKELEEKPEELEPIRRRWFKKKAKKKEKPEIETPGGTHDQIIFEQIELEDDIYRFATKGTELPIHTEAYIELEDLIFYPLKKCPWPLPNEPIDYEDENKLYQEIRDFCYEHLDYSDPRFYDLLTCWILASWRVEEFEAIPYLFFHSPVDSGKTRALEALSALCFRGWLTPSLTPATLFRCVQSWKPTLLLDETEFLTQEARVELVGLLNAGYRRGALVPRIEKIEYGEPIIRLFEVFGFKALSGTQELKETLQTRSIIFKMSKTMRPIKLFIDKGWAQKLRNKLLMYRFNKFKGEGGEEGEDFPTYPPLTGRIMELFYPLIKVAPNQEIKQKIIEYALDLYKIRIEEEKASIEAMVLSAVIEAYESSGVSGRVTIRDVTDVYNRDLPDREKARSQKIGYITSRLGFKKTRLHGGPAAIIWDEELVNRLKKRYLPSEMGIDLGKPSPSSPSSPLKTVCQPCFWAKYRDHPKVFEVVEKFEPDAAKCDDCGKPASIRIKINLPKEER